MSSPSPAGVPALPPLQIGPDSPSNTDNIELDASVHHPFDEERNSRKIKTKEVLPWHHTAEVLHQAVNAKVVEGGWVGGDEWFGSIESCVELMRVLRVAFNLHCQAEPELLSDEGIACYSLCLTW
jgi:hypothetical protein